MNRIAMTASAALAGLLAVAPAMAMSTSNLPPQHEKDGIAYRAGGIGEDESRAMKQAESQYPLALEFVKRPTVWPTDVYLANIRVSIHDDSTGSTTSLFADGPFLLARLPAGEYRITASDHGVAKTRDVRIDASHPRRVVFVWS